MSLNEDNMSSIDDDDEDGVRQHNATIDSEQSLWNDCVAPTIPTTSNFVQNEIFGNNNSNNNFVNNVNSFSVNNILAMAKSFANLNSSSTPTTIGAVVGPPLDFVPHKKSIGKFKFLSAPEADSSVNSYKIESNNAISNSSLYNGILDDYTTTASSIFASNSTTTEKLIYESNAAVSMKPTTTPFISNAIDEPPPPPPPPPVQKRGRGRPSKTSLMTAVAPIVTVGDIKGGTVRRNSNRIIISHSVDEVVNDVVRNLTLEPKFTEHVTTETTLPPPPPPTSLPAPTFIPTVIKKGPLKKAILSEMQHTQTMLMASSSAFADSSKTDDKPERPTTPTRPINVGQPSTPDTGIKLKSRWFYRSEQETPSSTTSSEIVTTTVVAVVPPPISNSSPECHVDNKMIPSSAPFFERIEDNIYFSDKKKFKKGKDSTRMICECSKEDAIQSGVGCGDECLNRILYYECGSNCPCGSRCTNKRFQKHYYAKVEPFPAGAKGHGLRTLSFIPKYSFVIEYVGEVLSPNQFGHRKKQYAKDSNHSHHYFMALKSDQIIDATRKGNISRFINHSCEPNCETQKWTVGGQLRIGFFTLRDVQPFEELTFDYKFQRYGKEAQKCYCGAPTCRGVIDSGEAKTRYVDKEERKTKEKESKNVFEDALFDREFEDTIAVGCLRNKDQVVTFGRLMLRADDYDSRRQLLDLLLKTEKNVLRLFIDLHGCRLLWSWTVDEEACGHNWQDLQLKLLDVLKILPIPHKNMLQDSRLLSTIERWAKLNRTKDDKTKQVDVDECVRQTLYSIIDQVCSGCSSQMETEDVTSVDDDADSKDSDLSPIDKENEEKSKELMIKCQFVLNLWSQLKENFKIPKKVEKKESTATSDEKSETPSSSSVLTKSKHSDGKSKKNSKKHDKNKSHHSKKSSSSGGEKHKKKSSSHSRSRSRSKSKDHDRFAAYRFLDYGLDCGGPFRFRRSPSPSHRHTHHHHKDQNRKRPFSRENSTEREMIKRTKEERRRVFEESVARLDEKKLYERQLQDFERDSQVAADEFTAQQQLQTPYWAPGSTPLSTSAMPMVPSNPVVHQHHHHPSFANSVAPSFPPEGARPAEFVHDQLTSRYWWRDQSTGVLVYMATETQIAAMGMGDRSCIPHFYHDPITGLIHEVHLRMQPTATGVDLNFASSENRNEIDMVCDGDGLTRDRRIVLLREQIATLQSQLDQKQSELKWVKLLEREETESSPAQSNERPASNLPDDWRVAEDAAHGKFYYYNVVTKAVQWEPPAQVWNEEQSPAPHASSPSSPSPVRGASSTLSTSKVKSSKKLYEHHRPHHKRKDRSEQQRTVKAALKIKNAAFPKKSLKTSTSMKLLASKKEHHKRSAPPKSSSSLSSSSRKEALIDEPSGIVTPFGTTTAAADTSSEVARKLKENFKSAMSNHIIKYLNVYRKSDCKTGRITNNEDFKHLARKLTHAIMEKELKHCHHVEDLHVTESVLHKAKDYIKRYMVKLGSTYKRSASSP